jgi:hypothetical protein
MAVRLGPVFGDDSTPAGLCLPSAGITGQLPPCLTALDFDRP